MATVRENGGYIEANMHDAKTNLSRLIAEALEGKEVVICKSGKPVVRLAPIEQKRGIRDLKGCMKGLIEYQEGWDAPLEGEELDEFYKDNLG